jgi:hypothetical protein
MLHELLLLERLSDADLALLGEAAGEGGSREERATRLRRRPADIPALLESEEVFAALFEDNGEDPLLLVSPFAAFAVVVTHASETLDEVEYVRERVGRRSAVPVFEVEPLRRLVEDPLRRLFLADLLASYTHVASGALWMKGRRGWSHRRFSELDPAQVAELALLAPARERVGVYRRLGDLALFLTGVFPDYVVSHPLPPVAVERLERALTGGGTPEAWRLPGTAGFGVGALELLEAAGQRAYQLAWAAVPHADLGLAPALGYMTEEFRHARMVLNFVTDSYLVHLRGRWFPLGEG